MQANEVMNQWLENSKAAMEPMRELNEISKRAMERMAEQNMAITKEYVEMMTRGMQLVASVRDPRALVNEQVELSKEMGEKAMANAESFAKLATETQGEYLAWSEKMANSAVAKTEEALTKAA